MKKLFLLDAFALIYRAYYSQGERFFYNSKGFNTTACFGFTTTLSDLIKREQPTHMAICWDAPDDGTGRASDYDFYKANREEMPEGIKLSLPVIREIIDGFNIPICEAPGYEADDVVGTIAKLAEKDGCEVFMVTPDKDYGQLVSEKIFMYKPSFRGKPHEVYGVQEILDKWDISRIDQVIDMLGLMGDKVDNIPGIYGVGEKTAAKLLKEFDSVENLLENTDQLKGKLKEKVENGKDDARISKELATIILDVPITYDLKSYEIGPLNKEKLEEIFNHLEFRTLGKRILGEAYSVNAAIAENKHQDNQLDLFASVDGSTIERSEEAGKNLENTKHKYTLVDSEADCKGLVKKLLSQKKVAFDSETTGLDPMTAELVGLAFSWKKGEAYYVPFTDKREEVSAKLELFKKFFEDKKISKIGQNIKYDMLVLKNYGQEVKGEILDTMLAHYLLEPDMRHNMNFLSETYLGYTPRSIEALIGKKGKNQKNMRDVPIADVTEYAAEDADVTFQLNKKFQPAIKKEKFTKLYEEVEMPLVRVLADMEHEGINLDVPFLNKYSKKMEKEIVKTKDHIFKTAGVEFNMDSPKQLGDVLFNHMKIEYKGKKTKTGQFSTNEETLQKLRADNPIIDSILDYRQMAKLKSTYVDALPLMVNATTNRIHTNYAQAVAATGRLSSNKPNLQNIPIRTDRGREVRKAFIPRDDKHTLLAADYSQIELRIMAEMSGDKAMKKAFKEGIDIHTVTASKVYNVDLDGVDKDMRSHAKMVNFGIIYGISAFGLSQRLGISRSEAKELIDNYFEQYPGIKNYMDESIEKAKKKGYCETILGRRRILNDINSKNFTVRSFAERNAINAPIQGSAADMIKVAMIDIHQELQKKKFQSKLLLQVHDELVFDARLDELDDLQKMVKKKMEKAIKMDVPILVEMGTGSNWLEAH